MAKTKTKQKKEEVVEVDFIVAHRKRGRNDEYLVRWKGYDSEEDSWQSRKSIVDEYEKMIENFHSTQEKEEAPKRSTRTRTKSPARARVNRSPSPPDDKPRRTKRTVKSRAPEPEARATISAEESEDEPTLTATTKITETIRREERIEATDDSYTTSSLTSTTTSSRCVEGLKGGTACCTLLGDLPPTRCQNIAAIVVVVCSLLLALSFFYQSK